MRKSRLRRASRLAVASALLATAGTLTTVASASATSVTTGVPAPYVTTSNNTNGSDPHPHPCVNNGVSGYCLFTSQDLNQSGPGGSYPMNQTMGYFSTDGITWTNGSGGASGSGKVLMTEALYTAKSGWNVASGTNHLWAPDAAQGADGYWYLYDPDITNKSQPHTSSFIGVSKASQPNSPLGSFNPDVKLALPANARKGNGQLVSEPNSGYASDPDVFTDTSGHHWVAWANGDTSNCGGISIAQLQDGSMETFASGTAATGIDIQNIPADFYASGSNAACTDSLGLNHLYEEGSHIYNTSSWGLGTPGPYLLVLPIKPADNAALKNNECANNVQGQPGTNNQAVVYATASSPAGPYNYGGLLMCGSLHEWTDQGGLIPVASHGRNALVMIYHDGPGGSSSGQHRTLHGECLMYGNGSIVASIRTAGSSTSQSGAVANCLNNPFMTEDVGIKSPSTNMYVSANGTSTGSLLRANRADVGPWEEFILAVNGAGIDPSTFNSNQAYVSTTIDATSAAQLVATDNSPGLNFLTVGTESYDPPNATQFNAEIGGGFLTLYSVSVGQFIDTYTPSGDDYLDAEISPPGNGQSLLLYHY